MPPWSCTLAPASGDSRSPLSSLFVLPRWLTIEGDQRRSSLNKLVAWLDGFIWLWTLPDLEIPRSFLCFPCHRGGEKEATGRDELYLLRAFLAVRSWSIFSVALAKEQWRLSNPGSWLPVSIAPPLTLLVEWQPHLFSSRPTSHKGGSSKRARWLRTPSPVAARDGTTASSASQVVLSPATSSIPGWSFGFGSDCNLSLRSGVLFAKSLDLFVISTLIWVLVRVVLYLA